MSKAAVRHSFLTLAPFFAFAGALLSTLIISSRPVHRYIDDGTHTILLPNQCSLKGEITDTRSSFSGLFGFVSPSCLGSAKSLLGSILSNGNRSDDPSSPLKSIVEDGNDVFSIMNTSIAVWVALFGGLAVGGVIVARIGDHFGRRWLTRITFQSLIISTIVASLTSSLWVFNTAVFTMGCGLALGIIGSVVSQVEMEAVDRICGINPKHMSLYQFAYCLPDELSVPHYDESISAGSVQGGVGGTGSVAGTTGSNISRPTGLTASNLLNRRSPPIPSVIVISMFLGSLWVGLISFLFRSWRFTLLCNLVMFSHYILGIHWLMIGSCESVMWLISKGLFVEAYYAYKAQIELEVGRNGAVRGAQNTDTNGLDEDNGLPIDIEMESSSSLHSSGMSSVYDDNDGLAADARQIVSSNTVDPDNMILTYDVFLKRVLYVTRRVRVSGNADVEEQLSLMAVQQLTASDSLSRMLRMFPHALWYPLLVAIFVVSTPAISGIMDLQLDNLIDLWIPTNPAAVNAMAAAAARRLDAEGFDAPLPPLGGYRPMGMNGMVNQELGIDKPAVDNFMPAEGGVDVDGGDNLEGVIGILNQLNVNGVVNGSAGGNDEVDDVLPILLSHHSNDDLLKINDSRLGNENNNGGFVINSQILNNHDADNQVMMMEVIEKIINSEVEDGVNKDLPADAGDASVVLDAQGGDNKQVLNKQANNILNDFLNHDWARNARSNAQEIVSVLRDDVNQLNLPTWKQLTNIRNSNQEMDFDNWLQTLKNVKILSPDTLTLKNQLFAGFLPLWYFLPVPLVIVFNWLASFSWIGQKFVVLSLCGQISVLFGLSAVMGGFVESVDGLFGTKAASEWGIKTLKGLLEQTPASTISQTVTENSIPLSHVVPVAMSIVLKATTIALFVFVLRYAPLTMPTSVRCRGLGLLLSLGAGTTFFGLLFYENSYGTYQFCLALIAMGATFGGMTVLPPVESLYWLGFEDPVAAPYMYDSLDTMEVALEDCSYYELFHSNRMHRVYAFTMRSIHSIPGFLSRSNYDQRARHWLKKQYKWNKSKVPIDISV